MGLNGFISKVFQIMYAERMKKKMRELFGSCLLNSLANLAKFCGNGLDWLCYLAGNS